MRIRLAQSADVDAIAQVVNDAYLRYVAVIGRRPEPMDEDYGAIVRAGAAYVAEVASHVVGAIVIYAANDHLLIENVAVSPGRQGQGIGRALMGQAESVAYDLGLSEIRLYTNAAMTQNLLLYPHLGYLEFDRRREHGFDRVFFAKSLI